MNPHIAYLAVVAWANGGTLRGANLGGADLGGADLADANLGGAYLRGANLADANLWGADLRGANLGGADLGGADLACAYLGGADLGGADLAGAKYGDDTLAAWVTSADRGDHEFRLLRLKDGSHKVIAGCRWMTIDAYRSHVAKEYPDTYKARRTIAILDYFEAVIAP